MWACRQFLNRRRPIHRLVLAGTSRAHASDAIDGDRHVAKPAAASAGGRHGGADRKKLIKVQPPESMKKKHLFLVLDDTNNGICIHKLDLKISNRGGAAGDPLERLPSPPVICIETPTLGR